MKCKIFNFNQSLPKLIIFVSAIFLSCSSEERKPQIESKKNVPTYSVDILASELPVLEVISIEDFDLPGYIEPYYLETFPKGGYVVTTDRAENLIHLFDKTGIHIAEAGGEGRGPGEFTGPIKLHAGWDNYLYVFNRILHRISRFRVDRDGFTYLNSYSTSNEGGAWLQNIYVTEWGNFGVIRSMIDFKTGEDEYSFYKLDDEFNQMKHLFKMPGNEKMPLDRGPYVQYVDHMAGEQTLWDLDGEWFYHISSRSSVINKYNLKTGEHTTDTYFNMEKREITDETRGHLMKYASNMMKRFPTVKEAMEEVTALPLFQEFLVHDNTLYLVILNISGSNRTEIIRIKEATDEVRYIKIPINLWKVKPGNGRVYGIEDTPGNDPTIRIVNLAK